MEEARTKKIWELLLYIVICSRVLYSRWAFITLQFNTQHLITVHNSSRLLTLVLQILELQQMRVMSSSF
jgi:hypothetical protein